jgi:hypothetical protein
MQNKAQVTVSLGFFNDSTQKHYNQEQQVDFTGMNWFNK